MTYFLDLFSGIGGFALGAEWARLRFDAHYYSEVDDYAIRVYQRRFPGAIALGDIRSIRGADLPEGDWIIAGGFPCQDISVAGKGAGLEGERSGLWYEYARLIGELRPRYAIMENVGALAFRGLDRVLGSLAALGYDAEWQDIRASDVGAPHRRERIWIVAYPSGSRSGGESRNACTDRGRKAWRDESTLRQAYGSDGSNWADPTGSASGDVPDAYRRRLEERVQCDGGREQPRIEAPCRDDADGCDTALADASNTGPVRRFGSQGDATGEARRGGRSAAIQWWAAEPDVGRVAHGVPARVDRLKCLGNSIVPQIAELIFMEIKGAL